MAKSSFDRTSMPWILIDTSWLAYRMFFSLEELSYDELPTGVMFGLLEQIKSLPTVLPTASNRFAFFFDSRQSYRRRVFPDYKKKRFEDRTPEEIARLKELKYQLNVLRTELLPAMGFPVYRQTGLESDDLLAAAAASIKDDNSGECPLAIIITADGDLYQCISNSIHWFDPSRDTYLSPMGFVKKKGVLPEQWADIKSLAGCSSDAVPGIPGCGEKTAIKYLSGNLPHSYKVFEAITSSKGLGTFLRNNTLIRLPHTKTKPIELVEPVFNPAAFFQLCKKYGMESYLSKRGRQQWESFFQGQFDVVQQQAASGRRARKRKARL